MIASPQGHTDPRYMASLLRRERVTWLLTVPSLALLYLEEVQGQPCDTLRMLVPVGASPLGTAGAGSLMLRLLVSMSWPRHWVVAACM